MKLLGSTEARALAITAQGFAEPREASAIAAPCARSSSSSASCRSIRSTCSCARTTCRRSRRLGAYDRAHARHARPPRAARAVRVLGPRGVAVAGRAAAAVSLAHGARGASTRGGACAGWRTKQPTSSRDVLATRARQGTDRRERDRARRSARRKGWWEWSRGEDARSSGCSGAARSRARRGAASSGSTICPSA